MHMKITHKFIIFPFWKQYPYYLGAVNLLRAEEPDCNENATKIRTNMSESFTGEMQILRFSIINNCHTTIVLDIAFTLPNLFLAFLLHIAYL